MTDPFSISLMASSFASGVAKGLGIKVGEAIGKNFSQPQRTQLLKLERAPQDIQLPTRRGAIIVK